MTATTHDIPLEPLSVEAFAPFGALIGAAAGEPVFRNPGLASWRLPFEADGAVEVMFALYDYQEPAFTKIERHHGVSQAFVPLGGAASLMVVAPRTEGEAVPAPSDLRAFLVPGDTGVLLHRGVWHALNRFPARPPSAGFALLTSAATQEELEREKREDYRPALTDVHDFAEAAATRLRVTDPAGLIG
ncbi:MAG: ureidoglycolate lyase [Azospirillaceae bacterium]